jgi:hypothetical protein
MAATLDPLLGGRHAASNAVVTHLKEKAFRR